MSLIESGQPYYWAVELVNNATSFEAFVTSELDKYDGCMAGEEEVCNVPRLLLNGFYDKHIESFLSKAPQHFLCIMSNVSSFIRGIPTNPI